MKKTTVTYLFIAAFVFLVLQYAAVGIIGVMDEEPWPAFVFPGFKSVYVYDDGFRIDQSYFEIIHNDGETVRRMLPHELFPELPKSQISGFMRSHFNDEDRVAQLSEEARDLLGVQAEKHAGVTPERIDIVGIRSFFSGEMAASEPDSMAELSRISIQLRRE
jgi:hypothetical protein